MSSAESRPKPDHIQLSYAAGVVQPAVCESKEGPGKDNRIAGGIPISRREANAGDDGQWLKPLGGPERFMFLY
jgi:hypothetical protein